jgi:hypothetical protein
MHATHDSKTRLARRFTSESHPQQDFVQEHPSTSAPRDCATNFNAGKQLPQMKGLLFTALMAGLCDHDIVLAMLNLQHGERYAYAYYLLLHIILIMGLNVHTLVYDINCIFKRYLANQEQKHGKSGETRPLVRTSQPALQPKCGRTSLTE